MLHLDTHAALTATTASWRGAEESVGFVPTMGALHAGHLSLVGAARAACDRVVVSVFLNPTQFAPTEDLDTYPSDLARDRGMLEEARVDAFFTTTPDVMYPPGYATWVSVEGLTDRLCGASRDGHFRGVTTVVTKLLNLVGPCHAFFGEKDRQQLIVLRRMVADLNLPVTVVGCPIVREPDGLALSSRNAYLDSEERRRALALSAGLRAAEEAFASGVHSGAALEAAVRERLEAVQAEVEYVELVDPDSLARLEAATAGAILAVAARVGKTRLIDNHALGRPWA